VPTTKNPPDPPNTSPPAGPGPSSHQARHHADAVAVAEHLRERLRLFLILVFGLLVVVQLPLPFRLPGIVLGVAAFWIGLRLLRAMARLRRVGVPIQGSIVVAVGLGLSTVLLLMLVAEAVYYPLVSDLQRCRSEANTQTARTACERDAKSRVDELVNRLGRAPATT
jgi:hypothetical protein